MKKLSTLILSAFVAVCAEAQNPYLPMWEFVPDGEPYVFEDPDNPGKYRVYIYGSHDYLKKYYCGRDQVVWSAPVDSLDRWRYDGVAFELKKDRDGRLLYANGDGDVLYAPDVTMKRDTEGRKVYYMYPNVQSNERGNLVAKSYRPDGPFEVCNWSDSDPRRTVGPFSFDPAAFVDDDGRAYGYWGFLRSYAAELDTATMCTVKPGTEIVEDMIPGKEQDRLFRFFEASSIRKIKDKYVFIYSRWTNDGEFSLPQSNYTLAYCYSNSPLGPWTYGGTVIDGRGKERRADGTMVATACPYGNTHGSICEIGGKWYVFYHRQAGTSEYSRQATVAPINVEVMEGKDGYVRISEAEFTSEGFATDGLDPYREYPAGIACYFTSPEPPRQKFPNVFYTGSHIETIYPDDYQRATADHNRRLMQGDTHTMGACPMVNNTDGSVVGYKYFNLSKTYGKSKVALVLDYHPEGIDGTIDIYLDRPSETDGGIRLASLIVSSKAPDMDLKASIALPTLNHYNGKHALFLVFRSPVKGKSVCRLNTIGFKLVD